MTPTFSIAHTTARPEKWRAGYDAWIARAANPEQVEYVLCVDERWGFKWGSSELDGWTDERQKWKNLLAWNYGPKSSTSGWNTAAAASTGKIIILNADDMRPPQDWDTALLNAVASRRFSTILFDPAKGGVYGQKDPLDHEFVIHVSVGGQADERGLIILQILSRARYDRLGYALYPGYESMYSDDEFTEHAKLDGCYIDARHLRWTHYHPFNGVGKMDEVYKWQNRPESYEAGRALFEQRKADGFPAWIGE